MVNRRPSSKRPRKHSPNLARTRCNALIEQLEPRQLLAVQVYDGPLNDKIVFTSGGHGWEYVSSLNRYATERPDYNSIVEDFGNQDQMSFFVDYVLRAGGTVVPMRPVGHQTNEVVLDNDSPGVSFSGAWTNSGNAHRYDEDYGATADAVGYRFATATSGAETSVATYQPNIPEAGFYPVYTWVLDSANRTDQLYRINHSGGTTELRVDHRRVGKGWVYLGTYHFAQGSHASGNVQISNNASIAGSVIADAIRFGNGMGDFTDSGAPGPSPYPREDENSYKWIRRSLGTGVSVSGALGSGTGNVSAPSNMAEWMYNGPLGGAVYIGFHSNGTTGDPNTATARGAIGLIDSDQGTPNQQSLALFTGRQINQDMQALNGTFEHNWSSRTSHFSSGGFGEIDLGSNAEMDATIIEVGFHDTTLDADMMKDPKVRDQLGRSTYEAALEYFDVFGGLSTPAIQPDQPRSPRAIANANGSITLNWTAPAVRAGGPQAPTGYRIYQSRDGYGFGDPIQVGSGATTFTIPAGNLDGGAYYFKVAAFNTGGEGPGSAVVGARKNGTGGGTTGSRILIVNGFDRLDRTTDEQYPYAFNGDGDVDRVRLRYNNTFDYIVQAGEAIETYTTNGASLGFDTAQNEHIIDGAINLNNYHTVIWLSGEESTADETFSSTEQSLVSNFLNSGGRLFVSGSEIGWDLDRSSGPTDGDRAFYNNFLKADHPVPPPINGDDANTYTAVAASGSIFGGMSSIIFDNGSQYYDAEFPDILIPVNGAVAALNYSGGAGGVAAIQYDGGPGGPRIVNFGFPFETITNVTRRNNVMQRVLNFFETAVVTSPTPGAPDLAAGSDSGASSSDNLTNRDNSTAGKTLQFNVSGTVAGATVRIYIDDIIIGVATASGTTTTVTTNGTSDLPDGVHSVTATQQVPGGSESAASAALNVTIDTTGPTITGYTINQGAAQRSRVTSLIVAFDQGVSFSGNAFSLVRRGDNLTVTPTVTLIPVSDGRQWQLTFSGTGTESGSLADGVWDLTVAGANTSDIYGNTLAANGTLALHRLFGDSDGNRTINNLDYARFRSTFGKTSSQSGYDGSFDFDGNGVINNLDYGQFRNRFGSSI